MARNERGTSCNARDRTELRSRTSRERQGWLSTGEWTFVLLLIAQYYLFAFAGTVALVKALDPMTLQVCNPRTNQVECILANSGLSFNQRKGKFDQTAVHWRDIGAHH